MKPLAGIAAGVPYTGLAPGGDPGASAPLIVSWHMLDAPRTDAAFAAALPMDGVPAWRVHLGMPMCGARMVDGRVDAAIELIRRDPLLAYAAPFIRQAVGEFPAALDAVREQLPVDDGPIGILGASLGAAVALEVLTSHEFTLGPVALVNPAIRARSTVGVIEAQLGQPYRWTDEAHATADELDFVRRADEVAQQVPLLVVSGEQDHATFRNDADEFVAALRAEYEQPDAVETAIVPGLAHSLADEPGLEPAPQLPRAALVDEVLTSWFRRQFTGNNG